MLKANQLCGFGGSRKVAPSIYFNTDLTVVTPPCLVGNSLLFSSKSNGAVNVYEKNSGTLQLAKTRGLSNVTVSDGNDVFVAVGGQISKYTLDGTTLTHAWSKTPVAGTYDHYAALDVVIADSNYIYGVFSYTYSEDLDGVGVIKISRSDGAQQWNYFYRGSYGGGIIRPGSVSPCSDGGVIVSVYGGIDSVGYLYKLNSSGVRQWNRTSPLYTDFREVALDSSEYIYLIHGNKLHKLSTDGSSILWSKTIDSVSTMAGGMFRDKTGGIWAMVNVSSAYGMLMRIDGNGAASAARKFTPKVGGHTSNLRNPVFDESNIWVRGLDSGGSVKTYIARTPLTYAGSKLFNFDATDGVTIESFTASTSASTGFTIGAVEPSLKGAHAITMTTASASAWTDATAFVVTVL